MECYIGQVLLVPYTFAPIGWLSCEGQMLPIQGNETLFSLIGTTYGGDGQTNFALPDLRGRTPIGWGTSAEGTQYQMGSKGGCERVALDVSAMPPHSHAVRSAGAAPNSNSPAGHALAENVRIYDKAATSLAAMSAAACGASGGGQQHNNMQPYLPLKWIIATEGLYPQPS